jgi:hypothetical protein
MTPHLQFLSNKYFLYFNLLICILLATTFSQKMPPKRKSSTQSPRLKPKGKEQIGIKPLALFQTPKAGKVTRAKTRQATKAKIAHVVTPSNRTPIEVETVEESEDDLEDERDDFIQVTLAKKRAAANKVPVVTPAKKRAAANRVQAVVVKKVPPKAKKIKAVINVKTGNGTIFKTDKQVDSFFAKMNAMGVAEDLKTFVFDNQEDYDIACTGYKRNDDPPPRQGISTPTAGVAIAASKPASLKTPTANPLSQALYARLKKPVTASNPLASHVQQKLSGINGTSLKLSLFPQATCVSNQEQYQVFAIDLVENKTDNTLWTHKPEAWCSLFQIDEELTHENGGQRIDNFFYCLQFASPRSEPKGPNVKKQLHTKNGKTIDCQLLWGMIKCTPDTEATLTAEIVKFSTLASNQSVQEAYHVAVLNLGTNFPALLEQVQPPKKSSNSRIGEYWTKLSKSCASPIKVVQHASMDEVFQDEAIISAVSHLWEVGGESTSMWSPEMNMFAFGRT